MVLGCETGICEVTIFLSIGKFIGGFLFGIMVQCKEIVSEFNTSEWDDLEKE